MPCNIWSSKLKQHMVVKHFQVSRDHMGFWEGESYVWNPGLLKSVTFSRKNVYSDSWSSKDTIDSLRVIMFCSFQGEEHSSRPFLCLFLILVSYFELVLSSPQMQIFKICLKWRYDTQVSSGKLLLKIVR